MKVSRAISHGTRRLRGSRSIAINEERCLVGAIQIPPLSHVVEMIAKQFGVDTFVETGTFRGDASRWAASHFAHVITMEVNPQFFEESKKTLGTLSNVRQYLGDSGTVLKSLAPQLTRPCLFWLDAHAGGGNFADQDNCPLLAELEAINSTEPEHFIFVDDSRAFVAPPPPPFDWRVWPPIDELVRAIQSRHRYKIAILNDAVIAVPPSLQDFLVKISTQVRPTI